MFDLSHHLASLIAGSVRRMSKEHYGVPMGMSDAVWMKTLLRIADGV